MPHLNMLETRLYHDTPPGLQTKLDVNATLIISWWCTIFSLTAILIRIFGRWVRTERLFSEDKIMCYSIIPLLIRMGLVHVVLIWGTNNTETDGLTQQEIRHREIGSKLVLAARIFYAAYIWIAKLTVLEFLKRTIGASWAKSYELGLRLIYGFLGVTFVAVIVGTLSECHPFNQYWQVVPDPGAKCREGLVQLIVMGVCDMVTDVVLVVFPIPLVWQSTMRFSKKISLILLFLMSLILIAITAYRIPSTIERRSSQQYRSLLASLEILAAAGVANSIIIGSFIRDKGVKKAKFRAASLTVDDEGSLGLPATRTRTKSITRHHWGSDEDLIRSVGVALPPDLRHINVNQAARPAEMAITRSSSHDLEAGDGPRNPSMNGRLGLSEASRTRKHSSDSVSSSSTDIKLKEIKRQLEDPLHSDHVSPDTPSKMGFFDVGGLVSNNPSAESPSIRSRQTSVQESAQRNQSSNPGSRTGSRAFLTDIGGLLASTPRKRNSPARSPMRLGETRRESRQSKPTIHEADEVPVKPTGPDDLSFSDAGGLLR